MHEVELEAARRLIEQGAEWIDIRYPERYDQGSLAVKKAPTVRDGTTPNVVAFPRDRGRVERLWRDCPHEVRGMDDNEDRVNPFESTIDKIDQLYTEQEWAEKTRTPPPLDDYAQTATGKSLADLIDEMDQHRDALAPAAAVPSPPPPVAVDRTAPRQHAARRPVPSPVSSADPSGARDRVPPDEEVARVMREFEQRIRRCVESVAQRRIRDAEQHYADNLARVKRAAQAQIRAQATALRQSYEAKYRKKEQLLRGHYKKLMTLAHRTAEQKVQIQQARKQFEDKLAAANDLYRQVEDMRRLLRNHLGGLEDRISTDMSRFPASS